MPQTDFDARVCGEVLGWTECHVGWPFGPREGFGFPPNRKPGGHKSRIPDFTRPENDYMVLKKVREEWGRDLQHGFICWLASRWDNRAGLSFIAYLPGDYARAALAVVEGEDADG